MSAPELISASYQDIMAVTQTHLRRSGDVRTEHEVDEAFISEFNETHTLRITNPNYPMVHLFFMKESIVRIRHSREILPEGSEKDYNGDASETITGRRYITSEDFVAVESDKDFTKFVPLKEIVEIGVVPDHTASLITKLTDRGSYGDPVTRALLPIMHPDQYETTDKIRQRLGLT